MFSRRTDRRSDPGPASSRSRTHRRPTVEVLEDRVTPDGRSVFPHVTDGAFTGPEWSDVPVAHFASSSSFLYTDQADLDPGLGTPANPADTFMLMYDEVGRTAPLGPDKYFLVSFTTVETENGAEHLEHYNVHIFTDGTIIFFENGELEHDANGNYRVPEIEGQRGRVGFGPSPNSATPHVIAEFEIKLSSAGAIVNGSYSPEPQFWTSEPPEECEVPPLSPITDPVAQQYEQAAPNAPLRLDLVDATLVAKINAFIADVRDEMSLTLSITSGYRPTAYQAHLYELRQRKIALMNLSPEDQQHCQDLINEVNEDIQRHGLNTNANGIPTVQPPGSSNHETGDAIDLGPRATLLGLTPQQLAQFNQIAAENGLVRPHVASDPVHFEIGSDPASLNVEANAVVNLLVRNDAGQRIGFDPAAGSALMTLAPKGRITRVHGCHTKS